MAIPSTIEIQHDKLPDVPGVYFYYGSDDELLYIGKATSLRRRVRSYFNKKYESSKDSYAKKIGRMVKEISRIEYVETPTVIEALVLEANQIRAKRPKYNVLLTDDKSFLYLVITNEDYPRPLYKRGLELAREGVDVWGGESSDRYLAVYGPFTSPRALKKSLELLRKTFRWSTCQPGAPRQCFYAHIKQCPGVCIGKISKSDYRKHIRGLMDFFEGKKGSIIKRFEKEMKKAADELRFEEANELKKKAWWLQHIRDISVITKDFAPLPYENPDKEYVDALGRVEAYDISNISGTSTVGSMVVFQNGRPEKRSYRKFKIRGIDGPNDVGAMKEMIERRLRRAEHFPKAWALPDLMVIDGGKAQVNAVQSVLDEFGVRVPLVGLAKGADRKKDELIYDHDDVFLARIAHPQKELFQRARDEAHRFAVKYHRQLRNQR